MALLGLSTARADDAAVQSDAAEAEQARTFSEQLLRAGMARQAYVELMRPALTATDPAIAHAWQREAGAMLWRAERFDDAAQHFAALGDRPDARLGLAYSLAQDHRLVPAAAVLAVLPGAQARYLDGFVALHQHDPLRAMDRFQGVGVGVDAQADLGPLALQAAAELASWGAIPARSPAAAGVFSAVLPGSGQAYAGRWGEAASAFLVNGLLAASAVELGRRQLWFGMGLVLVFETGFYGGNVMSAVNGARRFNQSSWDDRLGPLEDRYGMHLVPGPDGWVSQPAR